MKQKRFSDEQIIGLLKEADAGAVVLDLCRKHGMSSATFYAWKSKYGGLDADSDDVGQAFQLMPDTDSNPRRTVISMIPSRIVIDMAMGADSGVMSPAIPTNRRPAFRAEVARHSDLMLPTIPT